MTQGDSVVPEDVELLRSQQASEWGLTAEQMRQLEGLADKLVEAVELPVNERAARLRKLLTVPDVELVRDAASSIRRSGTDRPAEEEGPQQTVQRLDALALKLAAYLPPRNGG